jgi:hypothetical protein
MAAAHMVTEGPAGPSNYRFGRQSVRIESADAEFTQRFHRIFSDCRDASGGDADVVALLDRDDDSGWLRLRIEGDCGLPFDAAILPALLPELRLAARARDARGLGFAGQDGEEVARVEADCLWLRTILPWQILAAHFLVHQVLSAQRGLLYLHAATVAMANRGVLLCGDKGAGKSTLSLTLAGRGHGFLGDEVAVVDPAARVCLPFQRSVSVRPGPLGLAAADRLQAQGAEAEQMQDGTLRRRAPVSSLFPAALSGEVPLGAAFFLRGFDRAPQVAAFDFAFGDIASLQPLNASLAGAAGQRALRLMALFATVTCYWLTAGGTPDATAALIENTLETAWA